MDILGIGPLELVFILIIALIVLGPNDMVKAGRNLGRLLRKVITSSEWRTVQQASNEFRNLPNKLIREAGLEDIKKEIPGSDDIRNQLGLDKLEEDLNEWQQDISPWTTPPHSENVNQAQEVTPGETYTEEITPNEIPTEEDTEDI
jgi:sec-independent protein translocase protein TatB